MRNEGLLRRQTPMRNTEDHYVRRSQRSVRSQDAEEQQPLWLPQGIVEWLSILHVDRGESSSMQQFDSR